MTMISAQKLRKILQEEGAYTPSLYERLKEELGLNMRPLVDRKLEFTERLRPYVESIGKDECNKFFNYWTAKGDKDLKMRFEKERTFDIEARLRTWLSNSKKFSLVALLTKR